MDFEQFKKDLSLKEPPPELSPYLQAMWYDANSNWEMAHNIIQDIEDQSGSWIHAYLHRKEGDIGNADYWYRRAGKIRPPYGLNEEWEKIVNAML